MYWDKQICLLKIKQIIEKEKKKTFIRNKEKSTEQLGDICPPIWQRMLDSHPKAKGETLTNRNVVIQKDADYTIDPTGEHRLTFRVLGESNIHKTDWRQQGVRKTKHNILSELV